MESDVPVVAEGDPIGPYTARCELGRGGMGAVVAAWDPRLRREIAIKVMRRGADDPGHRARVIREAQALARLSHPNVIPVYDVGIHDGMLWVAMERVEGPTLNKWLSAGRTWREVVDAFIQAAQGLAAAHTAGLVHRDFKPSNAMVGPDERVMVLDFGLAWAPGVDGSRSSGSGENTVSADDDGGGRDPLAYTLTAAGAVLGTPPYMAPEQHERSEVDARADQYALCVALYEGLYGRRPFTGSIHQLAIAKQKGPPPRPRNRSVPRRVWKIVEVGLATDPDERWPGLDALIEAMETARQRSPWLSAALAVGALSLTGAAAATLGDSAVNDRCTDVRARVDEARSGGHRQAMDSAFAGSTWEGSEAAGRAVATRVDAALDGWATDTTSACKSSSLVKRTATLDCVERALDSAEAMIEVFATSGSPAIIHAQRVVVGLPEPAACSAAEPSTAPQLDPELRRELARARALFRGERTPAAMDAARGVLQTAQHTADELAAGHALLLIGGIHMDLGDWNASEPELKDALWAGIAQHDDALTAAAATKLVHLCAHRFDPACAQPWIRHAEAGIERLGDAAHRESTSLELALGDVALRRGRLDEALERYDRVLKEAIARGGEDQLEVAAVLGTIGIAHAEAGRHETAIETFERGAAIEARVGGPLSPDRAGAFERLAASYHGLGRIAEARESIDTALEIIVGAFGPDHPRAIRLRGNLVNVLLDEGRSEEALALAQRVVTMKRRVFGETDIQVAMALTNEGSAFAALERHPEAVGSYRAALELWERGLGPDNPTLWYALNGLAHSELATGEAARALASAERALALVRVQGSEPDPSLLKTLEAARAELSSSTQ